jgi:hypothetical protein
MRAMSHNREQNSHYTRSTSNNTLAHIQKENLPETSIEGPKTNKRGTTNKIPTGDQNIKTNKKDITTPKLQTRGGMRRQETAEEQATTTTKTTEDIGATRKAMTKDNTPFIDNDTPYVRL